MFRAATCAAAAALVGIMSGPLRAQTPPVIDMHIHSMPAPPGLLSILDSLNIRYLFLAGLAPDLESWRAVAPGRHLPALVFPCDSGRAPVSGQPCGDSSNDLPDLTWLRGELQAGRIRGFGELLPQFVGMSPADPRLEPYWALAEEFDIPVGIHMGFGPRGAGYETSAAPLKAPLFRMAASDPMLLEDILLRHKQLRLFVMHAGWPRLESMMALLYAHPGVYVDIAGLQLERAIPRAEYDRYLRGLVQAGFGKRIMFGSDFADQFHAGVEAVMRADYLTAEQKSDILCGNAARFLRLEPEICNP